MSSGAAAKPPGAAGKIEIALAALTLFIFTESFLPKLLAPPPEVAAADENTFLRYLWLPFYALVIAGLVLAGRRAGAALLRAPILLALSLLAIASMAWSLFPDISMRRGIALLATTLLGVYLAVRFDWLTSLRLIAGVWLALCVATLVAGLVAPSFAVDHDTHVGAWTGGWWEKNQLGGHAARAAYLFAFLAWRDAALRKVWIGAFILGVGLVGLSTSATALLGLILGCGVLGLSWQMVKGRQRSLLLVWAGGSTLATLTLVYVMAPGVLLSLIGKDPTLTGRTDIWNELGRAISARPLLGYGYQAFWAPLSEPRYWLQQAVDWAAPSGHNGWLDLAVSLGLVGAALFAVDFLLTIWRAVKASATSPAGVFALGALAQFALFSMSESIILWQNSIIWATYAFISAKLALDAARRPVMSEPGLSPPVRLARVGG